MSKGFQILLSKKGDTGTLYNTASKAVYLKSGTTSKFLLRYPVSVYKGNRIYW
jgi:hypothetical protein